MGLSPDGSRIDLEWRSDYGCHCRQGAFAMTQVGTVMYMSPERFRGERYSYPSDTWSVGVITLEALTGQHPFEHIKSYMSLQAAICSQPSPVVPDGTAPDLTSFVAGCLLKASTEGKDGRPAVRQLINGPWLKPHSLGSPEAVTVAYLQGLGLLERGSVADVAASASSGSIAALPAAPPPLAPPPDAVVPMDSA